MKTYIVTGGAGFIGSHLVDRLIADGHRVVVIDDLSNGKEENIIQHFDNHRFIFYQQSILYDISIAFKRYKVDAVFHLAALPRIQFSIQFPMEAHSVNSTGTLNVIETALSNGVKRFVYAASSSAYGNQPTLPYR